MNEVRVYFISLYQKSVAIQAYPGDRTIQVWEKGRVRRFIKSIGHSISVSRKPVCGRPEAPASSLFFFFFFKGNFILFIYLFLAVLGLRCCMGFLSLRWAGATLHCGARASHCGGFSCCGAWALGVRASAVVAHRLSSVVHGLSCSMAWGILSD